MHLAIIVLATAVLAAAFSGERVNSRLRLTLPTHFLISVFEWFGELGQFCRRLLQSCLAPPYELRELVRQCDEIGSK